ncbi:MAG: hypothetical protein ACLGH0_02805 [Thermoanaerobaculia bacterium]
MPDRKSAGLPLSVGSASFAVRIAIAAVFLAIGAICVGGAIVIAKTAAIVAAIAILPLGLIAVIAAAFVLAPHSRFGVWLDHSLHGARLAILLAAVWGASALVLLALRL